MYAIRSYYEHALDVELHARLVVDVVQVEGRLLGHVEEGRVLERALSLGVDVEEGLFGVVGDLLVELGVVLVLELALGTASDRGAGVDLSYNFV